MQGRRVQQNREQSENIAIRGPQKGSESSSEVIRHAIQGPNNNCALVSLQQRCYVERNALTHNKHRLNLYDKHKYIFNDSTSLNETDYAVKVWGPILETIFEDTDVIPKW